MKSITVMRYNSSGVELVAYNDMVFMMDTFFEISDEDTAKSILQKKPTWNQDWSKIKHAIQVGHSDIVELEMDDQASELVAEFAYNYLVQKGHDDYICSVLLETKITSFIFDYLRTASANPAVEQVVIDSNDPFWALEYCEIFGEVPHLKEILKQSNDAEWISRYCINVNDDLEMVEALKNTGNVGWWNYYLQNKQAA